MKTSTLKTTETVESAIETGFMVFPANREGPSDLERDYRDWCYGRGAVWVYLSPDPHNRYGDWRVGWSLPNGRMLSEEQHGQVWHLAESLQIRGSLECDHVGGGDAVGLTEAEASAFAHGLAGVFRPGDLPLITPLPPCVVCGKPMDVLGRVKYCESQGLMPSHAAPACSGDPKAKAPLGMAPVGG